MTKRLTSAASVLALALVLPASIHAEDLDSEKYLTIGSVRVEQVDEPTSYGALDNFPMPAPGGGDLGGALDETGLILDKILNMGKKVWTVIEANRPVVNVQVDAASALPAGTKAWDQLAGWNVPKIKTYRVLYENLYGWDVVDFKFRVIYTYGGNVNGKGRYLTQVSIVPASLDVSWGYTFNAVGNVPSVVNTGSVANPVAGMQVQLKWSVDTVMKHNENTMNFFVKGDGEFTSLND